MVLFVISGQAKWVNGSSASAAVMGFDVDGLEYLNSQSTNSVKINGEKYYYGGISMWSSIYKKYDSQTDSMFYVVLIKTCNSSSLDSPKNGYYRMVNHSMNVKVYNGSRDLELLKYYPEQLGSVSVTQTQEYSVSLGASKSTSAGISGNSITANVTDSTSLIGGVSWGQSVYKSGVSLQPSSVVENTMLFNYEFTNRTNKSVNKYSPLRGDYIQRSVVVYELENYSKTNGFVRLQVAYTGKIQKVACLFWGCKGCDILDERIEHNYNNIR